MKKAVFFKWAFYLLLAGNAVTLFLLLSGPMKHREPKFEIIERLGFDEQQVTRYEQEIAKHKNQIRTLEDKQRSLKHQLFQKIDSVPDSSLLKELTAVYESIQLVHYTHFSAIKDICKPNQLAAFHELEKDLPKLFAPHHPPRK